MIFELNLVSLIKWRDICTALQALREGPFLWWQCGCFPSEDTVGLFSWFVKDEGKYFGTLTAVRFRNTFFQFCVVLLLELYYGFLLYSIYYWLIFFVKYLEDLWWTKNHILHVFFKKNHKLWWWAAHHKALGGFQRRWPFSSHKCYRLSWSRARERPEQACICLSQKEVALKSFSGACLLMFHCIIAYIDVYSLKFM